GEGPASPRGEPRRRGHSPYTERATPITVYLKQFTETPNAGDAIGAAIVKAVTGRRVCIVGEAPQPGPNLIGIGSIAHWADEHSVLWGCGLIAAGLHYRVPADV